MRTLTSTLALFVLLTTVACAKDGSPAFTRPKEAGIDYKIQGEYKGSLAADGSVWGVQVIALGEGTFRAVAYQGGLPGDGWSRGDRQHMADGKLEGEVARFEGDQAILKADGKTLTVESFDGEPYGELKKIRRKSPTLGKKAPEGSLVLFDGTSLDHWVDGKIVRNKWLAASNTETKEKFGDHTLHIEFRTPFMPTARGQARGNSGVYVQGRYEVQVLDSFGLEGKDNECGGIYQVAQPIVNMCLPPLQWQTYDIDFTSARYEDSKKVKNARITVRHNGVVIHDDVELPHATPGRYKEGPEGGPLFLQNHGNPVVFRNIWVINQ